MVCLHPFNNEYGQQFPCGKCVACRIQKSREWAMRCLHELESWDCATFLTLTYEDEKLPVMSDGQQSLVKSDLQKFFKRLRSDLKQEDRYIKYFACGEYGETTERPHYHAIVYGVDRDKDINVLSDNWGKGHIYTGTVTYNSCRYVADYVLKGGVSTVTYLGREKPFRIISQGLGLDHVMKNEDQYVENMKMTCKGNSIGIPRYYKKKLGLDGSCFVPGALESIRKDGEKYARWVDFTEKAQQRHKNRVQQKLNIEAKLALKKREPEEKR